MYLWNKVLVGLIAVAALAFFYFSMRTLKTHQVWRDSHNRFVAQLEQEQKRTAQLTGEAGPDVRGILQAKRELHDVLVGRGRVWRGVQPGAVDANGAVSVTVEDPQPHQIAENLILYVFDERPIGEGGVYVGEFKVTQVAETQIALAPSTRLTDAEIARVKQAVGPWMLYDVMPADSHVVLANLSDDELRELFPGDVVREYLKDGKPAEPNDPPERVEGNTYVRQLNDYAVLFREYRRLRSIYVDLIAAAARDKAYIESALADSKQDEQFRRQEIEDLKVELAKYSAERDAVLEFRQSLDQALTETRDLIAQLSAENKRLAARYAAWQVESARRAEEAAAQAAGSGGR